MREGLAARLSREEDLQVVAEAAHGQEAVEKALSLPIDVVVIDMNLRCGTESRQPAGSFRKPTRCGCSAFP